MQWCLDYCSNIATLSKHTVQVLDRNPVVHPNKENEISYLVENVLVLLLFPPLLLPLL